VLSLDEKGKISLSIKKAQEGHSQRRAAQPFTGKPAEIDWDAEKEQKDMSFEDMMANFKLSSDARMLDLKRNVEGKRSNRRK
jgi:S1 RNA binding domain protein